MEGSSRCSIEAAGGGIEAARGRDWRGGRGKKQKQPHALYPARLPVAMLAVAARRSGGGDALLGFPPAASVHQALLRHPLQRSRPNDAEPGPGAALVRRAGGTLSRRSGALESRTMA